MHSFLELHAQTFYTNFSSTYNFVQWNYLYCANNVFSYCDQNLLSDEKVQALRFLITFFAATTIIFKTILLNNVVFHVLYFDFVVSQLVQLLQMLLLLLLTLDSCSITYKQPYEGVLNKYLQNINLLKLFLASLIIIIFDLVVIRVMFQLRFQLSVNNTLMDQCYRSLLPDAAKIVSHK